MLSTVESVNGARKYLGIKNDSKVLPPVHYIYYSQNYIARTRIRIWKQKKEQLGL